MSLNATFGNGDILLWMLEFFLLVIWFWLLIVVFSDLFRDHDTSGWAKAFWVLFVVVLPYLGILVYLIVRGRGNRAGQEPARLRGHQPSRVREAEGRRPRILSPPERKGSAIAAE